MPVVKEVYDQKNCIKYTTIRSMGTDESYSGTLISVHYQDLPNCTVIYKTYMEKLTKNNEKNWDDIYIYEVYLDKKTEHVKLLDNEDIYKETQYLNTSDINILFGEMPNIASCVYRKNRAIDVLSQLGLIVSDNKYSCLKSDLSLGGGRVRSVSIKTPPVMYGVAVKAKVLAKAERFNEKYEINDTDSIEIEGYMWKLDDHDDSKILRIVTRKKEILEKNLQEYYKTLDGTKKDFKINKVTITKTFLYDDDDDFSYYKMITPIKKVITEKNIESNNIPTGVVILALNDAMMSPIAYTDSNIHSAKTVEEVEYNWIHDKKNKYKYILSQTIKTTTTDAYELEIFGTKCVWPLESGSKKIPLSMYINEAIAVEEEADTDLNRAEYIVDWLEEVFTNNTKVDLTDKFILSGRTLQSLSYIYKIDYWYGIDLKVDENLTGTDNIKLNKIEFKQEVSITSTEEVGEKLYKLSNTTVRLCCCDQEDISHSETFSQNIQESYKYIPAKFVYRYISGTEVKHINISSVILENESDVEAVAQNYYKQLNGITVTATAEFGFPSIPSNAIIYRQTYDYEKNMYSVTYFVPYIYEEESPI